MAAISLSEASKSGVDYWFGKDLSSLVEWLEVFNDYYKKRKS